MSYDIYIEGGELNGDAPQVRGGTYALGGHNDGRWLNVTYNYAPHFYAHVCKRQGIRWLYGKRGEETVDRLTKAIDALGEDVSDDYWEATEGNARAALIALRDMAQAYPEGVWEGD